MKKKLLIAIPLLIVAAAAVVYFLNRDEKIPQVQSFPVSTGLYEEIISSIGNVSYEQEVTLKSEVGGRILTLNTQRSDTVSADGLLIDIDDTEARLAYDALADELALANARYSDYSNKYANERKSLNTQKTLLEKEIQTQELTKSQLLKDIETTQLLIESEIATPSELEELSDRLALQQQSIESLILKKDTLVPPLFTDKEFLAAIAQYDNKIKKQALQLEKYHITAPISGLVTEVFVTPGDLIQPGQDLMQLASLDQKYIQVAIDEKYLAYVVIGQEVSLFIDAYPDTPFTGTIKEILPVVDSETGTFTVSITIQEKPERFLKNMSVRVDLTTISFADALVIPGEYLVYDTDTAVYMADAAGVVYRQPITVYNRNLARVMVTDGLKAGDQILLPGDYAVGDLVTMVEKGDDQ